MFAGVVAEWYHAGLTKATDPMAVRVSQRGNAVETHETTKRPMNFFVPFPIRAVHVYCTAPSDTARVASGIFSLISGWFAVL